MRTSSKCHQRNSELEELAVVLPNGYESFRSGYKRLYESSLFSLVAGEVLEVAHHRKIIMEIKFEQHSELFVTIKRTLFVHGTNLGLIFISEQIGLTII